MYESLRTERKGNLEFTNVNSLNHMWNVVILFEDMLSIEYYDLKGVLFTQSNLKYFKGNINKKQ